MENANAVLTQRDKRYLSRLMELRHLRCFVAVAEELHFRRAALQLSLTQPAVSHLISQLEERLSAKLLDRSRQHVALTVAGKAMLKRAKKILSSVDDAIAEAARLGGAQHSRLRIGFIEFTNLPFLGPIFHRLAEDHPDIEVEPVEMYTAEVIAALKEKRIEVGFAIMPITHPSFVVRPVIKGRWSVVMPATDALANEKEIDMASLAKRRLIFFARRISPPLFDWLVEQCTNAGFKPRIAYQSTQSHVATKMALEGVGLFIVSDYVVREVPEGLVMRPIKGLPEIQLAAVWRADNKSPALKTFLTTLRKATATKGK